MYWRRWWQPTPVLLPGKSHGQRSLVGCSPWGHEELDMIERLPFHFSLSCIGEGNGSPLPCSCWRIPGTVEPGGLPSVGSHRVGHDWSDLAAAAAVQCILLVHQPWSHSQQQYNSHLNKACLTHVCPAKHIMSSSLGPLDSSSALCLRAILNGEFTIKKHTKMWKLWHWTDHEKKVCTVQEQCYLFNLSMECMLLATAHACEWLWHSSRTDFGDTVNFRELVNLQIWIYG